MIIINSLENRYAVVSYLSKHPRRSSDHTVLLALQIEKPWLVLAIFAGITVLYQSSLWIIGAFMDLGWNAIWLALIGVMVITFSMSIVLGCALGLLIRKFMVHK